MNKNKLILPVIILIASIVLRVVYMAVQIIKQGSIEKQQQIEIEQAKQEQAAKNLQKQQAKDDLDVCLNRADNSLRISFVALCNGDKRINGGDKSICISGTTDDKISYMTASNLYDLLFKRILDKREKDRAECLKMYQQ